MGESVMSKKETKKEKKVKSGQRKMYMISAISTHLVRYCIETDEKGLKELKKSIKHRSWDWGEVNSLTEFSQDHLGERAVSVELITDKEAYLKTFDEENEYLKTWTDDQKFEFINKN